MLDFRDHGDNLFCSGQITVAQLPDLVARGIHTIVCNRPDDEAGAVASQSIADAASALGMTFVYQPVLFSSMTLADGERFAQTLGGAAQPVLAYCRTGRRSAALWVMGRAPTIGVARALEASKASGCDLEELRPRLIAASG